MSFKSYLPSIKALIKQKLEDNTRLLNMFIHMTFSETPKEIDDGIAMKELALKDRAKLVEIDQDTRCIYNLTPHDIHFMDDDQTILATIKPSGLVARLEASNPQDQVSMHNFVVAPVDLKGLYLPIIKAKITTKSPLDKVIDLPPFEEGVYYIVSMPIFMAFPLRTDLLQVDPVRDSKGFTIGAKGFFSHP